MCDFKINEKVVCIDASVRTEVAPLPIKEGQTYVVSALWVSEYSNDIVVDLTGHPNICPAFGLYDGINTYPEAAGQNIGYRHTRFRKTRGYQSGKCVEKQKC